MGNILIILTHTYPYNPPTEQFLHEEINALKDYFDKIYVIPTSHTSWVEKKNEIDSVNIITKRLLRKHKLTEIVESLILFNKKLYKEIVILFKMNMFFNIVAIRILLMTLVNSRVISNGVLNEVIKLYCISKDSKITIYSYWLSHLANASIEIKEKLIKEGYQNIKIISRAHGSSDIYLPEKMNGYKVGLIDINCKINGIYSVSSAGKHYLETIGFNANLVTVNRLGIKDNGLRLTIERKEEFIMVSCSNLNNIKRVELIIEALSYIKKTKIHWIHFGDGPNRQQIEDSAFHNLNENIKFTLMGNVNNKDILEYYKIKSPDLFINVSLIEGIPVSIMEASSFGIPIIATNVGGTSEICINKYNGILLNNDFDILELVKSIKFFIEMSSEDYKKYSHNARQIYLDKFNGDRNYSEFVLAITSLT